MLLELVSRPARKISKQPAALPSVLEEDDKVRLVVAGDGPYLPDLKSRPRNLVFWIRWLSQV